MSFRNSRTLLACIWFTGPFSRLLGLENVALVGAAIECLQITIPVAVSEYFSECKQVIRQCAFSLEASFSLNRPEIKFDEVFCQENKGSS